MENNALVIGGNGFIGTNLCKELVDKGYKVYSFDLNKPENVIEGVTYLEGNFFDDEALKEAIRDKHLIIHSLSTINPGNSNVRFMQGYEKDFVQSIKLFTWAVEQNSQVIFLSSGGTIYGDVKEQPIKETQLPRPINHYGTVKLCIESVIHAINVQTHKKIRIARISNPYGPGQDYTKGVGFVDAALKKAIDHEEIEIWGDGSIIRDYIYIDDVCKMIVKLSEYCGDEEIFNVSSNHGVSLNTIIKEIRELGIDVNVNYSQARQVDVAEIILDNTKIKSIYTDDVIPFEEGLKKYYNFLKNERN